MTQAIHEGRAAALARLTEEASRQGASGVAGATVELTSFSGSTEFLFVGSCVHAKSPPEGMFTSAGDAQKLFCHMDEPAQHVFGNVAYSIRVSGGILGSLKTLARGEIQEFSDVFNQILSETIGPLYASDGGFRAKQMPMRLYLELRYFVRHCSHPVGDIRGSRAAGSRYRASQGYGLSISPTAWLVWPGIAESGLLPNG